MTAATRRIDDRRQILYLLGDTVRLMRAEFVRRAPGFALTPALIRMLFYVQRVPGCRQVEIAEWLDLSPVTVGRMIDRLERRDLVRRENDPVDRRVSRIHLGTSARAHMRRLNAYADRFFDFAFEGLSPDQRSAMLVALGRVHDNLVADASRTKQPKGAARGR